MPQDALDPTVLKDGVLDGLSCVVTGAGTGIGRAIARRLAGLGASVVGVGRRPEPLAETAGLIKQRGGTFTSEPCNVRDTEAVEALIQRVGARQGIDALVNNAGGQFASPARAISRRGWDSVIDLNLSAVFTVTKAAYPFLARRGGSVVNISLSFVERGQVGMAHSIAARAGVLALTRTLALEWAGDRIRLNCIGPGTVMTEGLSGNYGEGVVGCLDNSAPLGRNTTPAEVAELTAFLISRAGSMMTGQLIQIGGGAHLGAGLDMLAARNAAVPQPRP
jgi:citronellol/citronellal dehydrogenase